MSELLYYRVKGYFTVIVDVHGAPYGDNNTRTHKEVGKLKMRIDRVNQSAIAEASPEGSGFTTSTSQPYVNKELFAKV
jgi:hypothetical protein